MAPHHVDPRHTLSYSRSYTTTHSRGCVYCIHVCIKECVYKWSAIFFLHVAQSFTGYLFAHNTRITIVFLHLFGRLYRLAEKAFRLIVYFCCCRLDRLWCDHAMRYIQYIWTYNITLFLSGLACALHTIYSICALLRHDHWTNASIHRNECVNDRIIPASNKRFDADDGNGMVGGHAQPFVRVLYGVQWPHTQNTTKKNRTEYVIIRRHYTASWAKCCVPVLWVTNGTPNV